MFFRPEFVYTRPVRFVTFESTSLLFSEPPVITSYPPSRLEYDEVVSEALSLTCNVTSKPKATVTWYKSRDNRQELIQADSTWYAIKESRTSKLQLDVVSSTLVFQGQTRAFNFREIDVLLGKGCYN